MFHTALDVVGACLLLLLGLTARYFSNSLREAKTSLASKDALLESYKASYHRLDSESHARILEHDARKLELEEALKKAAESDRLAAEVEQQKTWHDRAMNIVLKERDNWRDMHDELDRNFDGTVMFYENAVTFLLGKLGRSLSPKEVDQKKKIEAGRAAIRAKSKDIVSTDLVKNDKGFLEPERKA